ncbi:MAG: hypothetical protein HY983_00335 [Candidatus Magasanikbacteria bacterium]|nr:hypothetical protein [Candidatus Magasanikbacteria bacterium]
MHITKGIRPEFTDNRGGITKILDDGKTIIKSTLIITSKAGSVRANHYHKTDAHYCYMLSGKMEYFEKPVGAEDSEIKSAILQTGDMVYSPAMVIHAFRFLEDTTWVVMALNSRHQAAYEADTVRVKLI